MVQHMENGDCMKYLAREAAREKIYRLRNLCLCSSRMKAFPFLQDNINFVFRFMVTNQATQEFVLRVPKLEFQPAEVLPNPVPELPYFCPFPYCDRLFREAHSLMFHLVRDFK